MPEYWSRFVSSFAMGSAPSTPSPKFIAFFLPQYHVIPENEAWWGPGFTDWQNVLRAGPRFPGHDQPHLPGELGAYDLLDPTVWADQANLADQNGISGFCYYHYWFQGRQLLQGPFDGVLATPFPDFPFSLCWANEDWTRSWDGRSGQVLVRQTYSADDDVDHIRALLPAFADRRYIRIDGAPLFLVYKVSKLPDPVATAKRWRDVARAAGFPDLCLASVESARSEHGDPRHLGFDIAVEFQPDWTMVGPGFPRRLMRKIAPPALAQDVVIEYRQVVERAIAKAPAGYPRVPCVMPGWDNSPRRRRGAVIIRNSTPALYRYWLQACAKRAERGLVFINAWNEWAEGCHLEPSLQQGDSYLDSTRQVHEELQKWQFSR